MQHARAREPNGSPSIAESPSALPATLLSACSSDPRLLPRIFEQPGSGLLFVPLDPSAPIWISPRLLAAIGSSPNLPGVGPLAPHPEDLDALRSQISHARTSDPESELTLRWLGLPTRAATPSVAVTRGRLVIIRTLGEPSAGLMICEATGSLHAPIPRDFSPEFHFRSLVESLPIFLWSCDVDGRCDYLSPQWIDYTGVPAHAQLGVGWAEQIHPDDRARTRQSWAAATQSKSSFQIEYRIRARTGSYSWFRTRARPLLDLTGNVVRWLGETSEFQAEHEQSEALMARLELASLASAHGIWDFDLVTGQIHWDPRMYELYGVFRPTFAPTLESWIERIHPDDRPATIPRLPENTDSLAPFGGEFRARTLQGGFRHLRSKSFIWRDGTHPIRVLGVTYDVTAERETLEALLANQSILDDFVWHAPAAIAMFDTEMRYLKTSQKWLRDFKLEGQDIIGKSHYEVFPALPEHWRRVHERALMGSVEFAMEDPFPRADGSLDWLEWEIRPWRRADRSIGGVVFFTQVITPRKNLVLALESQRRSLERSNRNLEEFAYAASHDLQEPLRAISGCAQLLSEHLGSSLSGETRLLVDHLVAGTARMRSLITDLLTYSRVGSQSTTELVELDSVLAEAIRNVEVSRAEAGATITCDRLPPAHGDRASLVLLFQNLIGNAIKYRRVGVEPLVSISALATEEELRIQVKDNGIGIEAQFHARIFQLFQRLHTRDEYPGNGIGLTLCSRIAEQHGGKISVESTLGYGSNFVLMLPRQGKLNA